MSTFHFFSPPFFCFDPQDPVDRYEPEPKESPGTTVPVMTLTRLAVTVTHDGVEGRRGTLEIKGHSFHSIERMGGYVFLPKGRYNCTLGKRGSNGNKCVHISHDVKNGKGERAGIVMHVANYPDQLAGCIAIGNTKLTGGVGQSGKAFDKLYELIAGSFKQGAKAVLKVEGEDMY